MTYLAIDDSTTESKLLLKYLKKQPFIEIFNEPNQITKRAIQHTKEGKIKAAKSFEDLISQLNK